VLFFTFYAQLNVATNKFATDVMAHARTFEALAAMVLRCLPVAKGVTTMVASATFITIVIIIAIRIFALTVVRLAVIIMSYLHSFAISTISSILLINAHSRFCFSLALVDFLLLDGFTCFSFLFNLVHLLLKK
jgi:hypothetical protein